MHGRTRVSLALAAAAALALDPLSAGAAAPGAPGRGTLSEPLVTGLIGPVQFAVDDGTIAVAQTFAGVVTILDGEDRTDIPVADLAGVALDGDTVYVSTRQGGIGETPSSAVFGVLQPDGSIDVIADMLAAEQAADPDHDNSYGFQGIDEECASQLPPELGPPSYTGQIDSNPQAIAVTDDGFYIADAGANAILHVDPDGHVRTVTVLPPQPTVITGSAAAALGLPECAIGLTYNFEPVPTDVEEAPSGALYVTTLPGGPEGPELGARGGVHRVGPRTGRIVTLALGYAGATSAAVAPCGDLYTTELFGNRVSKLVRGGPVTVVGNVLNPVAIECDDGTLYVAYNAFTDGSIATVQFGVSST